MLSIRGAVLLVVTLAVVKPETGVTKINQLSKEIIQNITNTWELINSSYEDEDVSYNVINMMKYVNKILNEEELKVKGIGNVISLFGKERLRDTRLELKLNDMSNLLNRLEASHSTMKSYLDYYDLIDESTIVDFARYCVSHDPEALMGLLERIHLLVTKREGLLGWSILGLILQNVKDEHPDLCELQMSQHQLIYDMYNTISLAEIKGYAMMQFSWMLLRIYGKGNFTQEASLTRQRYGQRTNQTAAAARAALSLANRDLHRCDPAVHKEGVTYDMVKRLLQGYIENEVDLNSDGTCRENCAYYSFAEHKGCFKDQFCSKQKACKGRIIDCTFVESDMWVCQPNSWYDHRRYQWIKYESGRTLGHADTCSGRTTKVDSWWKWNLLHCSYCFCLCEDDVHNNLTERFFSLREALADVEKNKVVTGLQLKKLGKVFHLVISEGTLGPRGSVTAGSYIDPSYQFDPEEATEGEDYHTLTYDRRAIDLDELDSPSRYVMTGVRFKMIGAHLHFEIRATPFNYTTGKLSPERSEWISNDNTDGTFTPRKKLELVAPDIPTRSGVQLPVDSKHDQYLEFTHSDMNKDAAQNTVPYIDIQPVQPLKGAALLSGAGIIHRGTQGSGGFLAAKVITYDFSKHVKAEMPTEEIYNDDDTTDFVPVVN